MATTSKLYAVILGGGYDRDKVVEFFEKRAEIEFWFFSLPNCVFVKSQQTVEQIFNLIEKEFGETNRVLVVRVTSEHFGRLPTDQWQYFP